MSICEHVGHAFIGYSDDWRGRVEYCGGCSAEVRTIEVHTLTDEEAAEILTASAHSPLYVNTEGDSMYYEPGVWGEGLLAALKEQGIELVRRKTL